MKKLTFFAFIILNLSVATYGQSNMKAVFASSQLTCNSVIPQVGVGFNPSTKLRRAGFIVEGIGIMLAGTGTGIVVHYETRSYEKIPGSKDSYPPDLWKEFLGVGLCINGGLCIIGGSTMIFFGQRKINKEKRLSFNFNPLSPSLVYRF